MLRQSTRMTRPLIKHVDMNELFLFCFCNKTNKYSDVISYNSPVWSHTDRSEKHELRRGDKVYLKEGDEYFPSLLLLRGNIRKLTKAMKRLDEYIQECDQEGSNTDHVLEVDFSGNY